MVEVAITNGADLDGDEVLARGHSKSREGQCLQSGGERGEGLHHRAVQLDPNLVPCSAMGTPGIAGTPLALAVFAADVRVHDPEVLATFRSWAGASGGTCPES